MGTHLLHEQFRWVSSQAGFVVASSDVVALCQSDGFGAGVDVQLFEQASHVELNCVLADEKVGGDGAVAFPGGKVLEHFEFPSGKVPSGDVAGGGSWWVQG